MDKNKPTIVVSKCLGFCHCRYDGATINDKFVESLKDHVNYITVCPEVDIGLGIPRKTIRLVVENEEISLYQPATEMVFTKEMNDYSKGFLDSLGEVHGFLLKGRSPSCGPKNVKVYLGKKQATGSIKGVGLFAAQVIDKYPHLAIEEEGRLMNYAIREYFLDKVYTSFRFEQMKKENSMKSLIKFHSNNKYLLMAYNQTRLRELGKIVGNGEKKPLNEVLGAYQECLGLAFARIPRKSNYINSFMHMFGYFSDNLTPKEKEFILDLLDKYKRDKIHLTVLINLLQTYAIKYDQTYLLDQTIWSTYPEDLLDISDSAR